MSKETDAYMDQVMSLLESLGVSDEYFCAPQRERWVGQVREAYEKIEQTQAKKSR
jgi:hypothetical protein